jgi:hypothetical protein
MRERIEKIYDNLYKDYLDYLFDNRYPERYILNLARNPRAFDQERNILRLIKNEINNAGERLPQPIRLRPDAKFFIMVIFHQMIAIPLIDEGNDNFTNQMENYITADLKLLINQSIEFKKNDKVREITAHTILTVMDRDWKKMNISKFDLWND